MPKLVYVLRHADTEVMQWRMNNPDALVVDPAYLPDCNVRVSSPLGELQCDALEMYFASLPEELQPTHAFFSPHVRAVYSGTRSIRSLARKIVPVLDRRLREIEFGIFDGLTKKGRKARYPEQWAERSRAGKVHYRPEGGQNWDDKRIEIDEFTDEQVKPLPPEAVAIVSCHEVPVNVFRWIFEGLDPVWLGDHGAPSASITSYRVEGSSYKLIEAYKLPPSPTGVDLYSMEPKVEP